MSETKKMFKVKVVPLDTSDHPLKYTRDHKFVAHFKNEITRKLRGRI